MDVRRTSFAAIERAVFSASVYLAEYIPINDSAVYVNGPLPTDDSIVCCLIDNLFARMAYLESRAWAERPIVVSCIFDRKVSLRKWANRKGEPASDFVGRSLPKVFYSDLNLNFLGPAEFNNPNSFGKDVRAKFVPGMLNSRTPQRDCGDNQAQGKAAHNGGIGTSRYPVGNFLKYTGFAFLVFGPGLTILICCSDFCGCLYIGGIIMAIWGFFLVYLCVPHQIGRADSRDQENCHEQRGELQDNRFYSNEIVPSRIIRETGEAFAVELERWSLERVVEMTADYMQRKEDAELKKALAAIGR